MWWGRLPAWRIPAVKDVVNCTPGIVTAHTDEADVVGDDHERVKTVKTVSLPIAGTAYYRFSRHEVRSQGLEKTL